MIEHPHCVTVDDAARDLKCTLRTVWRDPGVLQQVGFPLYTESAAGDNPEHAPRVPAGVGAWRVTEDVKRTLPARAMAAPR